MVIKSVLLPTLLPTQYNIWVGNKSIGSIHMKKLESIIRDLCDKDNEQEWFEFKENWFEPVQ